MIHKRKEGLHPVFWTPGIDGGNCLGCESQELRPSTACELCGQQAGDTYTLKFQQPSQVRPLFLSPLTRLLPSAECASYSNTTDTAQPRAEDRKFDVIDPSLFSCLASLPISSRPRFRMGGSP